MIGVAIYHRSQYYLTAIGEDAFALQRQILAEQCSDGRRRPILLFYLLVESHRRTLALRFVEVIEFYHEEYAGAVITPYATVRTL